MISEGAITAPSAPTAELFRKSRRERVFLLFLVFMDCLLSALGFVFLLVTGSWAGVDEILECTSFRFKVFLRPISGRTAGGAGSIP